MGSTHQGWIEEGKPCVYSRDVGDTGMIRLKGVETNLFIRFLWIMEKIRAFNVLLQPICALEDFYKGHFVVKVKENYVFLCSHQA